jgi:hypothetical protein
LYDNTFRFMLISLILFPNRILYIAEVALSYTVPFVVFQQRTLQNALKCLGFLFVVLIILIVFICTILQLCPIVFLYLFKLLLLLLITILCVVSSYLKTGCRVGWGCFSSMNYHVHDSCLSPILCVGFPTFISLDTFIHILLQLLLIVVLYFLILMT